MSMMGLLTSFLSLRQNQHKSRAELKRLQQEKLNKLLTYAYEHSDYYRRRFDEAGISKEMVSALPLKRFPKMDKSDLMAHFNELVTDKALTQEGLRAFDETADPAQRLFQGKYHVVHSSGSTGTPNYFLYDEAAWSEMLSGIVRGALWGMSLKEIATLLLGRPRILYVAATDGRYGGAMAVGDGIDGVGAHQLFLDINTPLTEWVQKIEQFQPNMVIGYPSAIQILADMARRGQIAPKLQRVVSCGEPLSPGLRAYLKGALHAEVINFYGASESLALGVEGAWEKDMVLFDDLNVIEVMDGEMYITCLYNFVQPLIRYHLTDKLVLKPLGEGPFSRAEIVLSRSEDVLWFESPEHGRDFLHPLAVEGFCVEGLQDYQFVQQGDDRFSLIAVASQTSQSTIRREMERLMRGVLEEKKLDWVKFSVEFRDEIRADARTGKKRLIVRLAA